MTTSSPSLTTGRTPGLRVTRWVSSWGWRTTGMLTLLLALLSTGATYVLSSQLFYPLILIDKPSFAASLAAHESFAGLAGFLGLLLCGLLLAAISVRLAYQQQDRTFTRLAMSGGIAGILWAVSGALGMVWVPLWSGASSAAQVIAFLIFVLAEFIAPFLLIFWTWTLKRLRILGIIGLLLVFLRSLVWIINALIPIDKGFYATGGVLNILALIGESIWLFWLFLLGFRLLRQKEAVKTGQVKSEKPNGRRILLKGAVGLALSVTGIAFVGARTGLMVITQPALQSDDVPAEPSFIATLFYMIAWIYLKLLKPIHTISDQKAAFATSSAPLPSDVKLEKVDAGGVPADRITVPGSGNSRWIFYTHGGGWAQGTTDSHRSFVARLARQLGATGLIPEYRLTPEHPFPAGLDDCVTAYRWLLSQGVAASQIVIAGESAGGNLALATTLSVRDSGGALPAVLIAISPATDMAMTGETFTTKALADPILGSGLAQDAYKYYTNHGATDPRNPLVSPLYADVHGMPPTLLQAGTQEVLLSDSIRMADKLKAAGVEVKLEIWPGMIHAFTGGFDDWFFESRLATQHVVKFIQQHLRG